MGLANLSSLHYTDLLIQSTCVCMDERSERGVEEKHVEIQRHNIEDASNEVRVNVGRKTFTGRDPTRFSMRDPCLPYRLEAEKRKPNV